jgi:hypothetical protein
MRNETMNDTEPQQPPQVGGSALNVQLDEADIVDRLYKNTPNMNDSLEAANEIQELRALLNPRCWTKEISDKWHRALPDLYSAFSAIRGG